MSSELYGDLEDASNNSSNNNSNSNNTINNINTNEIEKYEKKCVQYEKRIKALESELKDMTTHNKSILAEKEQLEKNMVLVYNTAMLEMSRKDKELNRLRNPSNNNSSSSGYGI